MVAELPMGNIGRELAAQQVHYFCKKFDHKQAEEGFEVGVLPKNALVTNIYVHIATALDNKKVQVGTEGTAKHFGETADGTVGFKEIKPENNKVWSVSKDEVRIMAKAESKPNSGDGYVIVMFVPQH